MTTTTTRTTRRTTHIPTDLGVRLPSVGHDGVFRPTRIVEEVYDPGRRYVVTVSGPVQTEAGKDSYASNDELWFGWDGSPVADLPEALRTYLLGPDALADLRLRRCRMNECRDFGKHDDHRGKSRTSIGDQSTEAAARLYDAVTDPLLDVVNIIDSAVPDDVYSWRYRYAKRAAQRLAEAGLLARPLPTREQLTQAIAAVTDTWDVPLDDVHDIPPIVNAVLALLAEANDQAPTGGVR